MSDSDDIQQVLGIVDPIVFQKTADKQHIFLTCSQHAPIRAGNANEALNFCVTMNGDATFTAWIQWEDGYIEQCCNNTDGAAMVEIIGGYFNNVYFNLLNEINESDCRERNSSDGLYYKVILLCEMINYRFSNSIKTIISSVGSYCDGLLAIKTVKRDMDKVYTLIAGGEKNIDGIEFESPHSIDIIGADDEGSRCFRMMDEIADGCIDKPARTLWVRNKCKTTLRHCLQLACVEGLYPDGMSVHSLTPIRVLLDVDDRLIVKEDVDGHWVDLLCNNVTPIHFDEPDVALLFRAHKIDIALFAFEIHWEQHASMQTSVMNIVDSGNFIKSYYGGYPLDRLSTITTDHLTMLYSRPDLVMKLSIACNKVGEMIANDIGLVNAVNEIRKKQESLEEFLKYFEVEKSSGIDNRNKHTIESEDRETEEILYSSGLSLLEDNLFSVQSDSNDGHSSIQTLTALRNDFHNLFRYITTEGGDETVDLIMLRDLSVTIIKSMAHLLIEIKMYSMKLKPWIMRESLSLIDNTIQLIYRTIHDSQSH